MKDKDVRILRMELLIEFIFRVLSARQDVVSQDELESIYRRIVGNPSKKLKKLNDKNNINLFNEALSKLLYRFGFIKLDHKYSVIIFKGRYDMRPIGKTLGLERLDYSYLSNLITERL